MKGDLKQRLGRRHARDDRDRRHLARAKVPAAVPQFKYWWDLGWSGDQGWKPQCVAYAWLHYLEGSPITHPEEGALIDPGKYYRECQLRDEWPGEDYDGTSVRAGAKYAQELGLIGEYLWAFDLQTMINVVLTQGPVIVGTNWYDQMFDPEWSPTLNRVVIRVGGGLAGGHAYLVNGVNLGLETFRIKNSWGTDWGSQGRVSISFADMERLLREDGEACLTREERPELTPV